jgi:hypothetical protein
MNDEELSRLYYLHYAAREMAMLYGTGIIKISMVDGKFEGSIISPNDYFNIDQTEELKNEMP